MTTPDPNLLFQQPAPASPDLVFGDTGGSGSGLVDLILTGTLPALAFGASIVPIVDVAVTGTFSPLEFAAEVQYRTNTQRPTVGKTDAAHQVATKFQDGPSQPQQDADKTLVGWETFFQKVTGGHQPIVSRLPKVLEKTPVENRGVFQRGTREHDQPLFQQQDASPLDQSRTGVFQDATKARDDALFKHQDGTKRHQQRGVEYREARALFLIRSPDRHQSAAPFPVGWFSRFQDGAPPPPGISGSITPPPEPNTCYIPNPHLLFSALWDGSAHLVFICDNYVPPPPPPPPGDTIVVPVQRVYIVLNTASLRRVSDNALIPTYSMSLTLDASSWAWGFDATIPMEAQSLVEPATGPVELLATVNGVNFRLLAENLSRERVFGKATLRVSGRGRNAILDAPYAPTLTFQNTIDRTAQQLAGDALTFNGVPLPWSVLWGLTDWLVPAEVFTHQGTHISALNLIAQAAGGYLQPHRTDQVMKILPKYPSVPWSWDSVTPDFELPSDITVRESIQWTDKPAYNRVFVSGQQQGVLGQVTRTGTAGDLVAPLVTDPLITHADAARQRGISILGDTGRVVTMGLSLPVLTETGVIEPGKFVKYVDGGIERLGIVRGTSVAVNGGAGNIKQQITVESFA